MSRLERNKQKAKQTRKILVYIMLVVLAALILAVLGFFIGYEQVEQDLPPAPKPVQVVNPDSKVISPLTGQEISREKTRQPPLAVMVDNSLEGRPQSGIDKADIILEMPVEGETTRLMALFWGEEAREIGPVRSARPYFLKRVQEYDAFYVHAGGSQQAKGDIQRMELRNLDQLTLGPEAFWRNPDRPAPNNLYTTTVDLNRVAREKDFIRSRELEPFQFLQTGEENPGGVEVPYLEIVQFNGAPNLKFVYRPENNDFLRFYGEQPHREAIGGQQLASQNVLVQFAQTRVIDGEGRLSIELIGEGKLLFFCQGKVYRGLWLKASLKDKTYYQDEAGNEFKMAPGRTWIVVVPLRTRVDYPITP